MPHDRRAFVSALASMAGVAAVGAPASAQTPPRGAAAGQWDLGWFDAFKGQHKQMYDYGTFELPDDTRPLRFVKNYLDTYRDVFGLQSPDINTAVGCHAHRHQPLRRDGEIQDRRTLQDRRPGDKQPAVRNLFLSDGDLSVKAMQARDRLLAVQRRTQPGRSKLRRPSAPVADVRADLVAGLNPGVHRAVA